jgi:hypothetical protein
VLAQALVLVPVQVRVEPHEIGAESLTKIPETVPTKPPDDAIKVLEAPEMSIVTGVVTTPWFAALNWRV